MNARTRAIRARIAAINLGESFNTIRDNTPMATRLRRINTFLATQNQNTYHKQIPLYDIFKKCEENDLMPVQEDGTPWSGFLTGTDGSATIDLAQDGKVVKYLHLTWHKMDVSGNYEVVAYVN